MTTQPPTDPAAESTTEPGPGEAQETDTFARRRRPRPVNTLNDQLWGLPIEPVTVTDDEAASHWDVTLWHRGTPG